MSRRGTSWFPGSALPGSSRKGNNGAEGTAVATAAAPDLLGPPGPPALSLRRRDRSEDMYSSEKHWTADLGVVPDWDHIQRHLQSWIQTRL